jgi:YD repeat-containing protein
LYSPDAYDTPNGQALPFDRLSKTTFPAATFEQFTYDALDRMATKVSPSPAVTTTYTCLANGSPDVTPRRSPNQLDDAGNRTRLTWPEGYYANYNYDALGRPVTVIDSGAVTLATCTYDALPRRTGLTYGNRRDSIPTSYQQF